MQKDVRCEVNLLAMTFGKCLLREFVENLVYKNLTLNLFILKGFVLACHCYCFGGIFVCYIHTTQAQMNRFIVVFQELEKNLFFWPPIVWNTPIVWNKFLFDGPYSKLWWSTVLIWHNIFCHL